MGNTRSDGTVLVYNDHLEKLEDAVRAIEESMNTELAALDQRLNLFTPRVEAFGSISSRVFSMIDRSEVGIFVLSASSPSAMYELGLMHALGKPVIPIAFTKKRADELNNAGNFDAQTLPHYLKDEYSILLNDFNGDELREKLEPKLRMIAGLEGESVNPEDNPITQFYGMPLLDVSATTGLATGYFFNFIRHQLTSNGSIFSRAPHLKRLVILVPQTLEEVEGMLNAVKDRALSVGQEVVRLRSKDGQVAVKADEQVRGEVIMDSLGPYVIDVPAPLKAQKASPRYAKLLEDESLARSESAKREIVARKERLEQAMIEKFFATIRKMANGPDHVSSRLEFMTVDELFAKLERF